MPSISGRALFSFAPAAFMSSSVREYFRTSASCSGVQIPSSSARGLNFRDRASASAMVATRLREVFAPEG